jgi:hypothetical protein
MKKLILFIIANFTILSFNLNAQFYLDLKVFLEGPYNGTTMNTLLNAHNLIPLSQPFNTDP